MGGGWGGWVGWGGSGGSGGSGGVKGPKNKNKKDVDLRMTMPQAAGKNTVQINKKRCKKIKKWYTEFITGVFHHWS